MNAVFMSKQRNEQNKKYKKKKTPLGWGVKEKVKNLSYMEMIM